MKKDKTGKYWIDENGNKWSVDKHSKDWARFFSETLLNCYDCTDCLYCLNCVRCIECCYCCYYADCADCSRYSGRQDITKLRKTGRFVDKRPFRATIKSAPKELAEILQNYVNRLSDKADEYATEEDRYHNFKLAGELQGTTPEKALIGMMSKHIVSVYDMVNCEKIYSVEEWDEKIGDSINYLLLLRGMVASDV